MRHWCHFLLLLGLGGGAWAETYIPDRVSVIMTTYNRQGIVMDAVRSILGQSYCDLDFIIVDDASTDGTFARLRREISDPRVQVYRLSKNVGMYAASNYALKYWVRGEYVTWQDSDDTSHPDRIYRQVEHMQNYPVDAVSIAHFRVHENEVNYLGIPLVQGPRPDFPILRRYLSPEKKAAAMMSMMRALFRTERVMEIGGVNGRNRMGMDSDFTKRFQRLFPTGSVQGQPLYFYSPRPDSLTVAKATALGSPARQKLVRRDLSDRCVSRLLWVVGANGAFRQRQVQDFWYPADLEVEAAYHPQPEAVAH